MTRFGLTIGLVALSLVGISEASAQRSSEFPNVVLLLVDDLGWRDVGPYGQEHIDTPVINQLAQDGMRYTQAYANAPVCSPSRVSILTGKNPARLKYSGHITAIGRHRHPDDSAIIPPNDRMDLPLEEQTFAELVKPAGYVTANIGKWHVGREGFWPEDQGFDVNIGGWTHGSPPSYFHPYTKPGQDWNPSIPTMSGGKEGDYLTDRLTYDAIAFMETNREKPFLLYLTHYGVHTPLQAPKALVDKYTDRFKGKETGIEPAYAAMVENMDTNIGRVIDSLKQLGLEENTLFILYSDNGGAGSATTNLPLRGDKGHLYEGGIRVPLIIKWPGRIDGNSTCDTPVIGSDLFPTIAEVTRQVPAHADELDGRSLRNSWSGGIGPDRDALYWYYPHYHGASMRPGATMRKGDLKFMEFYDPPSIEVYDLAKDPSETNNIASKKPKQTNALEQQLHTYLKSVDTVMHTPNPQAK